MWIGGLLSLLFNVSLSVELSPQASISQSPSYHKILVVFILLIASALPKTVVFFIWIWWWVVFCTSTTRALSIDSWNGHRLASGISILSRLSTYVFGFGLPSTEIFGDV